MTAPDRGWSLAAVFGLGGLGLFGLFGSACSTLADPGEEAECRSDAECREGEVCAVDQGRCLPGNEAAPRAHLGFEIRESEASAVQFRVEVDGCDCVIDEEANVRELALRRSRVSQTFVLEVTGESEDPDPPPDGLLRARFDLSQASRYRLSPAPISDSVTHPILTSTEVSSEPTVEPTKVGWPRHHPLDLDLASEVVLWLIDPDGKSLASRFLGFVPPRTDKNAECTVDSDCCEPKGDCNPAPNYCDTELGQCTAVGQSEWSYVYDYAEDCSRGLEGDVVLLDMSADPYVVGPPLEGATVRVRYADDLDGRLGIPTLAEPSVSECAVDTDCSVPDQYCDEASGQCYLALAGRNADGGTNTDDVGTFRTQVYTYCEQADPSVPLDRRYEITVQPKDAGPLPTVDYVVDAAFNPSSQGESGFRVARDLCVPSWGAGATVEVAVVGVPRTLVSGDPGYVCCNLACLPSSAEDVEDGPPVAPATCDGRSTAAAVRFEAPFVLEDLERWSNADCVTPHADPQGRVGSLIRTASCDSLGTPCWVDDVALGTTSSPRRYRVRVESPVGSVLASKDFELDLFDAPEAQTFSLEPRVLVTGVVDVDEVLCSRRAPGEGCAAREAMVVAERLRMPDEPDSVPGPYLHSVATYYDPVQGRDGAFILPLDPGGVYVLTALPLTGAEGGPAGYALVNLRADGPALEPVRLVLEDGVVVTLRLEGFDARTTVTPIDRGSYLTQGRTLQLHPDDPPIDLNEIGTCWSAEGAPQGCQIRRLTPQGSDLARSQVGVVRFTTRRSAQASCANRCPMAAPE
ncbi:hypothetical protein [Paraliomyxa miuraensis]|uniref:hypothetical protein n=1 Tax=Paraliomyxa miuraensis TaxID=376150 RepID=UPI0022527477|nr:hypothetical protein [Paraliomyxa miuraensis]MCX4244554.1 hypothetical protein [Paraliomyxa miuraensis]